MADSGPHFGGEGGVVKRLAIEALAVVVMAILFALATMATAV